MRQLLRPLPVGDRNPFEVFLLVAALLQGISVLIGAADPTSISRALPPAMQIIWAILLALGGTLALSGLSWPGDPFTGIEIKRVGLISTGFGSLVYGLATLFLGAPGLAVGIVNLAFASACLWRTVQLTVRLRGVRANLSAVRTVTGGSGGSDR